MATRTLAFPGNAPGSFFVDRTCIDCDTCRQVAPLTFVARDGHSEVALQPTDVASLRDAAHAALCCPTNSIGTDDRQLLRQAAGDFPLPIDEHSQVLMCGFTAASSFGATSYLLRRPTGNWLIDAPRWVPQLAGALERLGGLDGILLTHRDDVADAQRYARHFAARRVIHAADADAAPDAELVIQGTDPVEVSAGLTVLPVPGHTAGSLALLVDDAYCFTGDHVWYSRLQQRLVASKAVCWFSWPAQRQSMARLAEHSFQWLLPGHGNRIHWPRERMRRELADLVLRMREAIDDDW